MRNYFFIILFSFCANVLLAQHAGYNAVANPAPFKTAFAAASGKISTISSDFTQQKSLSMLAEKITSKGKFYFKKQDQVRMDYTTPYSYSMAIKGAKVTVKDGSKTNTMSAKSNKVFQQVNQLMMDCARGTIFDNRSFSVKLYESSNAYLADMAPLTKEMKNLFSKVIVVISKSNYTVSQVQMQEANGDKTVINYSNQKLNTSLSDALFTLR